MKTKKVQILQIGYTRYLVPNDIDAEELLSQLSKMREISWDDKTKSEEVELSLKINIEIKGEEGNDNQEDA